MPVKPFQFYMICSQQAYTDKVVGLIVLHGTHMLNQSISENVNFTACDNSMNQKFQSMPTGTVLEIPAFHV